MHQYLSIPFLHQRPPFPDTHHLRVKTDDELSIHGFNKPSQPVSKLVKPKWWSISHIVAEGSLDENSPGVVQLHLLLKVDESFIPEDTSIRRDPEQQVVNQIDIMRTGGQDGGGQDHAGTRNPQAALEAKGVPIFRRTVPIRGLAQQIIEKDFPRRGPTEMTDRQRKGVNQFTKVKVALAADTTLQSYFSTRMKVIDGWFNIIAPTGKGLGILREELDTLKQKRWKEIHS